MISGADIIIDSPAMESGEALEHIVRGIREHWLDAVVQDAESGAQYRSFPEIPFNNLREIFVYRSLTDLESWDRLGSEPGNASSMIHILASNEKLTIVVDDVEDPLMRRFLDEARSLLGPSSEQWALRP